MQVITIQFKQRFIINQTNDITLLNSYKRISDQFAIDRARDSKERTYSKAIQKITQLPFAIKVISNQHLFDQQSQLRNELRILESLNNQNCIRIEEQFIESTNVYLVMEYFKCGTLQNYLEKQGGRLQEHIIKQIMLSLFETISYIHSMGIVHRDLKPQNIFLRDYTSLDLVIGYFGLTDYCFQSGLNTICGSKEFMALEIMNGENYDFKVDIFSLGAICHKLFYGTEITQSSYNQQEPLISEDGQDFLRQCLETNPIRRISALEALQHPWFEANVVDFSILRGEMHDQLQNQWLVNDEGSIQNKVSSYQSKINMNH
ncbi:hypothetical protein pb186bvf_019511 [Paramecium bursaria]